jgi:cell division protein FtsQ
MAGLLIAAVVSGYQMQPSDISCTSLKYAIEDKNERLYVSEAELTFLLRNSGLYPVGRTLASNTLHQIETAIAHHPMVRTADCYITPRGEMRIRLTQRVPLLRVQTPLDTYFVDTDRRVMEVRTSVRDKVLVVTGNVGVQMATGVLADFAEWLRDDEYWHLRAHHLQVQNPQMVFLYLKDEQGEIRNERVVLGPIKGYESKLEKLRTFMENGDEATRDKHYTELDLRFKGQVIGRN